VCSVLPRAERSSLAERSPRGRASGHSDRFHGEHHSTTDIQPFSRASQAFFQDTIRNSYGPLRTALPLTLADSSYDGAKLEVPKTTDAPKPNPPSSVNIDAIDYAAVSAYMSQQPLSEGSLRLPDNTDGGAQKTVSDELLTPSPLLPIELTNAQRPTDFRHPALMGQPIIWLPKDKLGLVHEIERDLDSRDILYSTEGAEMDEQGRVHLEVPEDILYTPSEGGPLPSAGGDDPNTLEKNHDGGQA